MEPAAAAAVNVTGDPASPAEIAWTVTPPEAVGVTVTDVFPTESVVVVAAERLAAPAVTLHEMARPLV